MDTTEHTSAFRTFSDHHLVMLRLENFLLKLVVKEQPTSDEFRTTHGERTDAWLEDYATLQNMPVEEIRSRKLDSIFEEQSHGAFLLKCSCADT